MPPRQAQTFGHVMVMPSRMESLPYVGLETAASAKPLIATRVGGIAEIYEPMADTLVSPNDAPALALARAIVDCIDHPEAVAEAARKLRERGIHG